MSKYTNPIILCDYSDPDVIRVGDTFFLVASSFNFVPGLPVLASKNLVDWQLISYGARKIPLPGFEGVQNAHGIWAPSIRVHNDTFYIFFGTPDEGLFEVHTKNPYGEWSDWNCIWSGKGFEDPCPLWDDDGKVYLVHGYVKSRIGFNSKLGLLELDPVSLKAISEDKIIFDGTKTQPTIEGPKFYKRNGYYYIFAPAGGVTKGWQTVLRSKRIDGDYEEKIVLAQGKTKINGPHQGGWVQTQTGEDWFIHFQDRGIFGRICHLQPMKWENDWPVMGKNGEPVTKWKMPDCGNGVVSTGSTTAVKNSTTVFASATPSAGDTPATTPTEPSEFQFSGNAGVDVSNGVAVEKNAFGDGTLWMNPCVCTKKLDSKKAEYEREVKLTDSFKNSGIIFLGNEYCALKIQKKSDGNYLVYLESEGSENGDAVRTEKILFEEKIEKDVEAVTLKLNFKADSDFSGTIKCSAYFKIGGKCKKAFASKKFKTTNAHWVGGRYGFFEV
ncbi:MAG: glycoside hydrolase 43 family protein [Treponema sp.]|nr:glycoside hydrolase 43 family protein [Candidatus Treponema equifaecale]